MSWHYWKLYPPPNAKAKPSRGETPDGKKNNEIQLLRGFRSGGNSQGTIHLVLDIEDTRHLERILKRLRDVPGIHEAERTQST